MHTEIAIPLLLTFLAGMSTVIGGLISFFITKLKRSYLCFGMGFASGVMIYISFADLLPVAILDIGFLRANVAFFSGIIVLMLIDFLIPHEYIEEHVKIRYKNTKLMMAGVFTTLGIAIHNFPEGMAVFMTTLKDINLGIPLTIAIALHNIPEGIAISMPIYYATKSRTKSLWYSFLAGIAEPIGAIIAFLILMPFLTTAVLSLMLAFVAGIMIFISLDELFPLSYQKKGRGHASILGVLVGMMVMAVSLYLL